MSKKRKRRTGHTSLAKHSKKGSTLQTQLSETGIMRSVDWPRDFLPEHLWIGALADELGVDHFHRAYDKFLDTLDNYWPDINHVALGLISDFQILPEENRQAFIDENEVLIEELFYCPIGRLLSYYPENPASWLLLPKFQSVRLDPEEDLSKLRSLLVQLIPGKDEFSARVRLMPFRRQMKHGKVHFRRDMDIVEVLPKYPHGCTDEEKFYVESTARSMVNMLLSDRPGFENQTWPKYFWRHNYDLAPCKAYEFKVSGGKPMEQEDGEHLEAMLKHNTQFVKEYLDILPAKLKCDLYDPSRDEIFFGLFSRVTRLYYILLDDPSLWARDLAGIMLRCLAETAITFCYLAVAGKETDFKKFIQYGEGQAKLLMLHLQDNYPEDQSIEGFTAEDLSDELGGFTPEFLDIELGHWSKKDTRKLAQQAGMERLYRLVFSPTSNDVHGSWFSLKNSNLLHCSEPLHRFHRLPGFSEPPLFAGTIEAARELYEHCQNVAIEHLQYPQPINPLKSFQEVFDRKATESKD